jgi:hypothetical protein
MILGYLILGQNNYIAVRCRGNRIIQYSLDQELEPGEYVVIKVDCTCCDMFSCRRGKNYEKVG